MIPERVLLTVVISVPFSFPVSSEEARKLKANDVMSNLCEGYFQVFLESSKGFRHVRPQRFDLLPRRIITPCSPRLIGIV